MSAHDLEIELRRWREPEAEVQPSNAEPSNAEPSNAEALDLEDALAYRNAGNIPDALGRSLRLVLHVNDAAELSYLQQKRLEFEPDFHDAPTWRREGSKPVNVVPLRRADVQGAGGKAWWDDPDVAHLEEEWARTGMVDGMRVPGEIRSFVYKTVLSLRSAGREVTPESVTDSIARWLSPEETAEIKAALKQS